MRSTTSRTRIAASPAAVWAALTSPAHTRRFLAGLAITSGWRPGDRVDAYHGDSHIAAGAVVIATAPSDLIYRLEHPATGDVDCWLSWHLAGTGPGLTEVTLTADSLPGDPPVDAGALLAGLKSYLEPARRPLWARGLPSFRHPAWPLPGLSGSTTAAGAGSCPGVSARFLRTVSKIVSP
jgi:uncharacterized protein YndB with AHSA1/START domain